MQTITTTLYALELPDTFTVVKQERLFIQAEDRTLANKVQFPMLSVTVYKIEELHTETYKGATLQEKFEDACLSLGFKSEKRSSEKTTINGLETFLFQADTDAPWMDLHFKIRYFYVGILLDDDYMLEFRAQHETLPSDELASWVTPAFNSLQIFGDADLRNQTWKLHEDDMEADAKVLEQSLRAQEEARRNAAEKEKQDKKERFAKVEIPSDGTEIFNIADFNFEFLPEETKLNIGEFSKEVHVVLKAKTSSIKKAVEAKLLGDYPKDGLVTLTIPAKGIHATGIPTGQLYFEDGKTNAPLFLNARVEGADYGLQFSGCVTFEKGWVILKGELGKSYNDLIFPVSIKKKFDVSDIQWQHYRFTSMEETATANPKEVRFLNLVNPDFQSFPDAILTFKNLEELTISQKSPNWEKEKLTFAKLPEAIGQLQQLKKIYINGLALQELPESIATLTALEQLSVNNCDLRAVPKGIWHLPQLKYLWLSSNQLTHISDDINLPALQNISLDKNQFKTLPENLAKQPTLKKIDLKGNPLESLPQAFNEITEIGLPMEDKLRLLDFDYKGADGKGLVPWNDAMFWSQHDTDLLPEIRSVIKENQLNEHAAALESMVKKAIGFTHTGEEDYKEIGNHRFGGMPDLPETIPYPRFGDNWREDKDDYVYEFLGQINCEQLAHLQDYLPRTGMLFFFLETIHSVYGGSANPAKVLYCEDTSPLLSGKRFQFSRDDYSEMFNAAYAPYKVKADKMNSAPSFYASYVNKHLFLGEAEKLKEEEALLDDLYDSFERPINEKNTFQYAVNAHGFTQHEAPELQASLAKKGNPEDWMTLMVFTSAGDMQWGDAGDLFFVIHKSDLAKGDFSNVFVTMESS